MREVNRLKAEGRYFQAGALAASLGMDKSYGCHFGFRTELEYAKAEYNRGYYEAAALLDA